jgi:hypothetical protein
MRRIEWMLDRFAWRERADRRLLVPWRRVSERQYQRIAESAQSASSDKALRS